jgi:sensor domain CHASE-containing protein
MKLRRISISGFIIMGLLFLSGQILVSKLVIERGYLNLEKQKVRGSVASARNSLIFELKNMDTTLRDWAYWDDTYQFARDLNKNYVESNFLPETFKNLDLDAIIILNRKGVPVYARALDPDRNEDPALAKMIIESCNGVLPGISGNPDIFGGILSTKTGDLSLVVKRPVLNSREEGPAMGEMLFMRRISRKMLNKFSTLLDFPIEVKPMGEKTGVSGKKTGPPRCDNIPITRITTSPGTLLMI